MKNDIDEGLFNLLEVVMATIVVKCSIAQANILWSLFKEYHAEIQEYASEMALPKKEFFQDFWFKPEREGLFLIQNEKAIGFTLLQVIENEAKERHLEIGAIFVQKKYRGFHSLQLYKAAIKKTIELNLPLTSEIASDNTLSLSIFDSLVRRYARKSNLSFKKQRIFNERYLITVEMADAMSCSTVEC